MTQPPERALPRDDGPLSGLTVLDLSWIVAGPTVGRALADYGATVLRVESTTRVDTARAVGPFHRDEPGVEQSALYGNVNAGKWGITLDLRVAAARDVFLQLVDWADIVCESFTSGILRRWQLDYEQLRQRKPDLIMLSSTLLGQTGPYRGVSGFGSQGAGMSGVQYLTGWADRPPAGPFGPYTDYPAPRFALTALLAALDHRRRTVRWRASKQRTGPEGKNRRRSAPMAGGACAIFAAARFPPSEDPVKTGAVRPETLPDHLEVDA